MYTKLMQEVFAEKYAEGHSWAKLGELTGVSPRTLQRWAKELGLPCRKPGAPKGKRERK